MDTTNSTVPQGESSNIIKTIITIIIVLIIIVGVYFFLKKGSSSDQQRVSADTIKIGLSAPMTGEAASWGQNAFAGAELAVQEINNAGGINGKKIQVITEDDACQSANGVSVMNKLINIDKVVAIAGPLCSAAGGASIPIVQNAHIPAVIIASAPNLINIGDYIYRIYPSDAAAGKAGAEFIVNKLNKKKVAVIYVNNDYGQGLKNVFEKNLSSLGGQIVLEEAVMQDQTDLRTELSKIKNSGAEAIYFPVYPKNAVAGLKQIKDLKLNLPVVGADSLSGEEVLKSGAAEGAIYTVSNFNDPQDFQQKIKALPGEANLDVSFVAALGYDTIKTLAMAIQNAGSTDSTKIKEALSNIDYGNAVSMAAIKFGPDREILNPKTDIVMIKSGKVVPYNQ